MADDLDLDIPATTRGLHTALEAIETACAAWDLGDAVTSRVRIVFEELFTNTVKYGYGGECERPVRFRISRGSAIGLTYEDDAPPFDPTAWKNPEDDSVALDDRPEGRAGIAMVLGLSATASYQRIAGANRLTITLSYA